MILRTLLFSLLFILPLQAKEKYTLSICAIFRNEDRFLKEWIEYHRMVGVEHFYLFNHLSDDAYYPVLEPYIRKGIVELFDWPYEITSHANWLREIQCKAYDTILNERKHETHWLAVIDTDEFLFLKDGRSLPKFLKGYEKYAALGVNWQLYGTSNVWKVEGLLLRALTRKANKYHPTNQMIKCIVQPKKIIRFDGPHFPETIPPYVVVNADKKKLKRACVKDICVDKIRINHYVYRDEAFYYGEKHERLKRKYPDAGPPSPPDPSLSLYEDRIADQYLSELSERVYGRD